MFSKLRGADHLCSARTLAHGLTTDQWSNNKQVEHYKAHVGWIENPQGKAAKLNYHARKVVVRHIKQMTSDPHSRAEAIRRLEAMLPVPTEFKQARRHAKQALRQGERLQAEVRRLGGELAQAHEDNTRLHGAVGSLQEAVRALVPDPEVSQSFSPRQRRTSLRPRSMAAPTPTPAVPQLTTRRSEANFQQLPPPPPRPGRVAE